MSRQAEPVIFVIDDDEAVRDALSMMLRSAGRNVETFASAKEFIERRGDARHGCIVLDVRMPGMSGLELQEWLAQHNASLPIVFLTGHGDVPTSVQAMKRGAADFLTKPADEKDLLAAIRNAFEKGRALRMAQAENAEIGRRLATLTPREREVLEHIVAGKRNKQVAGELGTVEKTVKVHRARVMEKMQARSLAELVRLAERAGIRGTLD